MLVTTRESDFSDRLLASAFKVQLILAFAAVPGMALVFLFPHTAPTATLVLYAVLGASSIFLDSCRLNPRARMLRSLRFKHIALVDSLEIGFQYTAQVLCLWLGLGALSLVIGQLVRAGAGSASYVWFGGRPEPLALAGNGGLAVLRRSRHFALTPIALAASAVLIPLMVVGGSGPRTLGYWAWSTVLVTPVLTVLLNVQDVLAAAIARLERLGGMSDGLPLIQLTAAIVLPIVTGLTGLTVFIAPDLVGGVFSPRWLPAVPGLRLALFALPPTTILALLAPAALARGRQRARGISSAVSGSVGVLGVGLVAILRPSSVSEAVALYSFAAYVLPPTVDAIFLGIALRVPFRAGITRAVVVLLLVTLVLTEAHRLVQSDVAILAIGGALTVLGTAAVVARDFGVLAGKMRREAND